ncbi:MAG: AraC family transcriptional regulator [Cyanobacteria bacterium P01_D01_bin.36]
MHSFKQYRHEQNFGAVSAVYGRQPSSTDRIGPSVSAPYSIDLAFIGHQDTWVRVPGGPTYARTIAAGTGGLHGHEPLEFVSVDGSSEYVELLPSAEVRMTAANFFKAPEAAQFDEIQGVDSQVLWAVASRFRAHAMEGWYLDDLEAEELIRTLVGHLICTKLGGRRARMNDSRLSARVLSDLRDYIEAHMQDPIAVKMLAEISNRSPYHFMRTFTLTTGMKPHEFVRAVRMERAKEALLLGHRVKCVATAVGYVPGHSFRRAFKQYFGVSPSIFVKEV